MILNIAVRTSLILPVCLFPGAGTTKHSIDVETGDFLRLNAGFGDRDLAEAKSGRRVVKTLDPGIPQEMVTVGVTHFQVPFDYYLEQALTGNLYRTGPTLLQFGRFSADPPVADMEGLTLDPPGDHEPDAGLDGAHAVYGDGHAGRRVPAAMIRVATRDR